MGRAIVRQPQVFLFDEPLSNLDAKLRAQTRLEIQKLHRELGVTSLFVTHDQVEAMTLAQRMIVMNAGVMEQFGTPEEVYARPATTFVAGFIGSPPMNLLSGNADGSRLDLGAQSLALSRAAPRSGALILGVRPEHCEVGPDGGWPLKVDLVEMLGAERLVHGRLGDAPFTLRLEGTLTPPRPGDTLMLQVAPQHLHWFDPATQHRVD
jgi:sn-glycerol 3-phosphate transport system ATP-binding protein